MGRIVGIGACVMDTLVNVPRYPTEDTKLRATSSKPAGGGPVATGLVAAAKLGAEAEYIGVLSDDNGGRFLLQDFAKYGVKTDHVDIVSGKRSFTSVIWLSAETTSRTCVFDKGDLPPLSLSEEQKAAIAGAELLMVDGNEMDAAVEAAKFARENGVKVLYDCGGLYDGVEVVSYPIYPAVVVDSNGSGDVFHGAFANAVTRGYDYEKCCHFSSAVSGLKCTGVGARESVPDFDTVKSYMKENGYDL